MAILYIDECGEEGFADTSSEWFILGGALQPHHILNDAIARYDAFKIAMPCQGNWFFHFQNASHDQRIAFIQTMRSVEYRAFGIAIHKPSLLRPDNFKKKYFLYFYALRMLLERATQWSAANQEHVGLYLSSRKGLKEENWHEYLDRVQNSPFVRIDGMKWDWLMRDCLHVKANKELRGLQMADCIASAIGKALEPSRWKTLETRYVNELAPNFELDRYRFRDAIKVWPTLPREVQVSERMDWLYRRD